MAWLDLEEELAEEFGELAQFDEQYVRFDGNFTDFAAADNLTVILPPQTKDERLSVGLCVDCGRESGGTRRCSFCTVKARRHQRCVRRSDIRAQAAARSYASRGTGAAASREERGLHAGEVRGCGHHGSVVRAVLSGA